MHFTLAAVYCRTIINYINYNCVSTELFLLQVELADLMLKQQNLEFGIMPYVMRNVLKNSNLGTRENWGKGNSRCGGI